MRPKLTPLQLVYTTVLSSLLVVFIDSFFAILVPSLGLYARLLVVSFMAAALATSFRAEHLLKKGSWEPEQRQAAYSLLNSRFLQCLNFIAGGLYLGLGLASLAEHGHRIGAVGILILPMTSIVRLRAILAPPRSPRKPIDWSKFAPLRSDHWGEAAKPDLPSASSPNP